VAHRLRKHADVAAELIRLTRDDLAAALAELDGDGPIEARVHSVRQSLKWVRSTLRVLQGALGDEARAARHEVAEAARLLATARDADVAAASARVLSATTITAANSGFDRVADALDREAAEAHRKKAPLGEVRRRLKAVAENASRFGSDFDGRGILCAAIARGYRRGRRAMLRAESARATSELHLWRKEAKHLWHLLRMARGLIDRPTKKLSAGLAELAELLGLDHDHAMLADKLALSTHDGELPRQLALISERRREMETDAFALGAKLYKASPDKFARRYCPAD
jgi:CHAD domain-containing protein